MRWSSPLASEHEALDCVSERCAAKMDDLIKCALEYAAKGHAVFPIATGTKVPHSTLAPHGFKDATTDEAIIGAWRPYKLTAIATEPGPRHAVLDIDVRTDGFTLMHELEKTLGRLPATATAITPSGGEHRWFLLPKGVVITSRSAAFGAPGVDVKSTGGYVLIPPSLGSQGQYTWDAGADDIAEMPRAWIEALTAQRRSPSLRADSSSIPSGARHDTLMRAACSMRAKGFTGNEILAAIIAMNKNRCTPPLPEGEVVMLAADIAQRYEPKHAIIPAPARGSGPAFVRAACLAAESEGNELPCVVDALIPVGGTAILAGRPKGGKSTLALNLAINVARGDAFLGRDVQRGAVLYLALEGARDGWGQVLRRMGVTDSDDLYMCVDRAPQDVLNWLREAIQEHSPILVIVDTMQRLLRVRDGNDYATGSNATDAVIALARESRTALLLLHHSGKSRHGDIVDDVMGSTAWAASVDSVLLLRRAENRRTIQSEQRFGKNLEETVLEMDEITHHVFATGTRREADIDHAREAIATFLREFADRHPEDPFVDEATIDENVEVRTKLKREALRLMVEARKVERIGNGRKGDPYRYAMLVPPVPATVPEQPEQEIHELLMMAHGDGVALV